MDFFESGGGDHFSATTSKNGKKWSGMETTYPSPTFDTHISHVILCFSKEGGITVKL